MTRHLHSDNWFRGSVLVAALGLAAMAFSQWSTDPAAPLLLAPAAGAPEELRAFGDGEGGFYTFWRDRRGDGTNYDVYGQRLDLAGNALWAADGVVVYHHDGHSVGSYAITRLGTGELMLAVIAGSSTFTDTMSAMLLDADATPLWSEPVTITQEGSPILGLGDLTILPTSEGAIIGWYDTYFGGSNGVNVARISTDGDLLWNENGYAIPSAAYGPFSLLPDGAEGAMVIWRLGNGLGAGYGCMRVDSTGMNAWDANVTPNAGGQGFGGNHKITSGPDGSLLLAYADAQNKVMLAGVDTTGALLFMPSPISVCEFASSQGQVSLLHENSITTVIWGDNRSPATNHDVYMQRFDADGNILLDPDGVLVMHLNTYIPNTGLVASLNEDIIATIDGNVAGYSAMRMTADGTAVWDAPVAFCTPAFNPFYENQIQLPDGEGGIVSFWRTFGGAMCGGRIYPNGELGDHTDIADRKTGTLVARPNPASVRITFDLPANEPPLAIELISASGSVTRPATMSATISLEGCPAGAYAARVRTSNGVYFTRFIKQ